MDNITIKDIFTTYWSQTTLILFGIGFLVQKIIDLRFKKTEINHTLFQQKKLESINTFFSNYAKTEQMWNGIAIYDIFENKMMAKDVDNYINPHLYEMQRNIMELNIYFKDDIFEDLSAIYKNSKLINGKLVEMFFYLREDMNIFQRANEFIFYRDKKFRENEILLKNISKKLQNSFE